MTIPMRDFGSTGIQVPVLGQGTWEMEHDDRAEALAALRHGLDLGMVHIDTAEMYGNGRVEELVGEAIRGRRDEVFLVSKVLPSNASRSGTVQACERSLQRLGTDWLDCYLLHWAGAHPLTDTIAAFEELVAAGKIRSYGVSNFDEQEVAAAVALAGQGRIACNQVLYHVDERAVEHAVIPFCAEQKISVVAYSPFGSGEFPRPQSSRGKVLGDVANKYRATPHQVALAFLVHQRSVLVIPKAAQSPHVTENAGTAGLSLGAEDLNRLQEAFPLGRRRPGVPTI